MKALLSLRAQLETLTAGKPVIARASNLPASREELRQIVASGEPIPVWSGASDNTIWGSHELNWRFRAWHDAHHVELAAEFDAAGEYRLAVHAVRLIHGEAEKAILWREIWGQVEYFTKHGFFPVDQVSFVLGNKA